jgi:hypothetical protein
MLTLTRGRVVGLNNTIAANACARQTGYTYESVNQQGQCHLSPQCYSIVLAVPIPGGVHMHVLSASRSPMLHCTYDFKTCARVVSAVTADAKSIRRRPTGAAPAGPHGPAVLNGYAATAHAVRYMLILLAIRYIIT